MYEKMFETVVTVEGENFKNEREERACYRLVKDTLVHLDESLEALENYNSQEASEELNSYIKNVKVYVRGIGKYKKGVAENTYKWEIDLTVAFDKRCSLL